MFLSGQGSDQVDGIEQLDRKKKTILLQAVEAFGKNRVIPQETGDDEIPVELFTSPKGELGYVEMFTTSPFFRPVNQLRGRRSAPVFCSCNG
jgi:hypothetical protein